MKSITFKAPTKKRKRILKNRINTVSYKKRIQTKSYWSCDACGGNSDTGCLMSDPQNCVRG